MSRIQNWFANDVDARQALKERKRLGHKKVKVFEGGEHTAYYVGTEQQIAKLSLNVKYEVKQ